ncbi:MAG: sulfatase-like hydrolase/transferase, partial [Pseudomonadota bacterium]
GFTDGMSEGWSWEDVSEEGWFFEFMGGAGVDLGRTTMMPVFDFIDENTDRPFFIWYGPSLPHTPLNPPAEHYDHYKDADLSESAKDYYGNITWFDWGIGALVRKLEQAGVLNNTLIVFVNDNGWEQPPDAEYKDDRDLYSNGGVRGKLSVFETAFRTPIIFYWRGMIEPRRDDISLVNAIDLVPTMLDYAGVAAPETLPGNSLRPLIQGDAFDGRDVMIGRTTQHRADSDFRGARISDATDLMGREDEAYYARDRRWHFVLMAETGETALYDMDNDPGATIDLSAEHPQVVARLTEKIGAWRARYVDP